MRFKASLSQRGIRILTKAFLPALEKCGKTCDVLLAPDTVDFVQTSLNTDDLAATAHFEVGVLFQEGSYTIASKHANLIAFNCDLGLLLRVLRTAFSHDAERLDVKLIQKRVRAGPESEELVPRPHLSFTHVGDTMTLVQDLPISKPYMPSEIDRLVASKEPESMGAYYVDVHPCSATLQVLADRMKSVTDVMLFAPCRNGDVHVSASDVNVVLGSQLRDLDVYPALEPNQQVDRHLPVEQQLQASIDAGDAVAVYLPMKHLSKVLAVRLYCEPRQILVGIGGQGAFVHVMFVFRDPEKDDAFDDSMAFSFRLPVVSNE